MDFTSWSIMYKKIGKPVIDLACSGRIRRGGGGNIGLVRFLSRFLFLVLFFSSLWNYI